MATSFKGLYLCPPKQPRPSHVQVQDAEQAEMEIVAGRVRGPRRPAPMAKPAVAGRKGAHPR